MGLKSVVGACVGVAFCAVSCVQGINRTRQEPEFRGERVLVNSFTAAYDNAKAVTVGLYNHVLKDMKETFPPRDQGPGQQP